MSAILDFHIDRESDEGYGLEVFTRSKSQPLASTKFDYPLSFMTEFELGLLDFDDKAPLARNGSKLLVINCIPGFLRQTCSASGKIIRAAVSSWFYAFASRLMSAGL